MKTKEQKGNLLKAFDLNIFTLFFVPLLRKMWKNALFEIDMVYGSMKKLRMLAKEVKRREAVCSQQALKFIVFTEVRNRSQGYVELRGN